MQSQLSRESILKLQHAPSLCGHLGYDRLYAYADDSTLSAVVLKPADRPAVAASPNRDLARIHEWCKHWCMILNPNKTKALVFSRSRTVNPPHDDGVLYGVSIWACPNLDILSVKFDSSKAHIRRPCVRYSQRIDI